MLYFICFYESPRRVCSKNFGQRRQSHCIALAAFVFFLHCVFWDVSSYCPTVRMHSYISYIGFIGCTCFTFPLCDLRNHFQIYLDINLCKFWTQIYSEFLWLGYMIPLLPFLHIPLPSCILYSMLSVKFWCWWRGELQILNVIFKLSPQHYNLIHTLQFIIQECRGSKIYTPRM